MGGLTACKEDDPHTKWNQEINKEDDPHTKWNQEINTVLEKSYFAADDLEKIITAVKNLRNSKKSIWDSNKTTAVNELKKILSQSQIKNQDWRKLDVLLSIIQGDDKFTNKISVYCDEAVKNKNWELLKLLRKNHCLSYQYSKDIIEKEELNYSHGDILKYYTVTNEKFNKYDVWDCKKTDLNTIKFIMSNLTEDEDRKFWQDMWQEGNDSRKYIKKHNVPEIILLQAGLEIGFVDLERAMYLLLEIDCESNNFELLNLLLKWKRQTSKVWTLY